jgi:4-diphosphocytidyl-2-C-methyl-D-erythritol kinase
MRAYSLIAPAKINLYLEILGDRPDGYHEMVMLLQSVSLADQIEIRGIGVDQIRVHCDNPDVPADTSNLAYKAADLMCQRFPQVFAQYGGVDITIHKNIPIGAGLAGGSTDAAAVLVGIDLLWNLGLTQSELQDLGAELGSDVPFCIGGGTAIATGRGEQLSPIVGVDNLYVILAKYKSLSVSTAWAYTTYRKAFGHSYIPISDQTTLEERRKRVHSGSIVSAISHQNGEEIGRLLYNDLEKVVFPAHPEVEQLRDYFRTLAPLGVMMSGSGPTVFALTDSEEKAESIRQQIKQAFSKTDLDVWVTQTIANGIQIAHA